MKAFLKSIKSEEIRNKLEAFLESIRSEETKHHYSIYLQKWFEFAGIDAELQNPQKKIIEFILLMKKQGKSYPAIRNYITPIKTYYQINDVVLNVKKIDRYIPEYKRRRKDKPYTHEQIGKLLSIAEERMKAVILLLCSSGIRICAIPTLRLGNLQDRMLTVYEGVPEEYITFITPECQKAVDFYLDMRARYGEKLNDDSYLIRDQFKDIQEDRLHQFYLETSKPQLERDEFKISRLNYDIRENAKLLSELGLGTPVIAAIKTKLEEANEIQRRQQGQAVLS